MQPTFDLGFDLPGAATLDTSPVLNAQSLHQQLVNQVIEQNAAALVEPAQLASNLQGQVGAVLQQPLFKQDDKVASLQNKVQQHLTIGLAEHYASVSRFGVTPPSDPSQLPDTPAPTSTLKFNPVKLGALPQCSTSWLQWAIDDPQYAWLSGAGPYEVWTDASGCTVTYPGGPVPSPGQTKQYSGDADTAMRYCFGCAPSLTPPTSTTPTTTTSQPPDTTSQVVSTTPTSTTPSDTTTTASDNATTPRTQNYVIALNCPEQQYQVILQSDSAALLSAADDGFSDQSLVVPVPDAETALTQAKILAVAALALKCPPPPITTPPPPLVDCSLWLDLRQGTEEWFSRIDGITSSFTDFGKWALEQIFGIDISKPCTDYAPSPSSTQSLLSTITGGLCQTGADAQNPSNSPTSADKPGIGTALLLTNPGTAPIALAEAGLALAKTSVGQAIGSVTVCPVATALTEALTAVMKSLVPELPLCSDATGDFVNQLDVGSLVASVKQKLCQMFQVLVNCTDCNFSTLAVLYAVRMVLNLFATFKFDVIFGVNFGITGWGKVALNLNLRLVQMEHFIDGLILYNCPPKLPDLAQSLELNHYNVISDAHFRHFGKWNGYSEWIAEKLRYAKRAKPSAHEQLEYQRRTTPGLNTDDATLRKLGYLDPAERAMMTELYRKWPDLNQMVKWQQKSAYNIDYIDQFNLLQGFAPDDVISGVIQDISNLNPAQPDNNEFWTTWKQYVDVSGRDRTQAALDYISAWERPDINTLRTFYHRLSHDQTDPDLAFDADKFRALLQAYNIPPYAIERIIATSYNVISQRYLLRLVQYGVMTREQVVSKLQDNGFSPSDAVLVADALMKQAKLQRATQLGLLEPKKIQTYYQDGVYTKDEATRHLKDWALSDHEVREVLKVADRNVSAEITKAFIASIRTCYMKGLIDATTAIVDLTGKGIEQDRASQYVGLWLAERSCEVKLLSAREMVDECIRGLISINQLAVRLTALDYDLTAVAYYVALAVVGINKVIATNITSREKQQEALQKAIQQQLQAQQRAKKKTAEIRLDVEKAQQKAQLLLSQSSLKQQLANAKATARTSKASAKQQAQATIASDTTSQKDVLAQHLANAKQAYLRAVARRKGQLAMALAPVKDATVKGQLHQQALADLAQLAIDYTSKIQAIKEQFTDTLQTDKSGSIGSQDTSDSTADTTADNATEAILAQLAQLVATAGVTTANETAVVKAMP